MRPGQPETGGPHQPAVGDGMADVELHTEKIRVQVLQHQHGVPDRRAKALVAGMVLIQAGDADLPVPLGQGRQLVPVTFDRLHRRDLFVVAQPTEAVLSNTQRAGQRQQVIIARVVRADDIRGHHFAAQSRLLDGGNCSRQVALEMIRLDMATGPDGKIQASEADTGCSRCHLRVVEELQVLGEKVQTGQLHAAGRTCQPGRQRTADDACTGGCKKLSSVHDGLLKGESGSG